MAPAEPPAAPAPSPAATASALAGWRSALSAWVRAHETYPEAAHRDGDQGRVVVRFTIARDGRVVSVDLVSGSGSASLDDAAQTMLRGATLPPFPSVLPEAQIAVTLPIRYSLER